MSALLLLATALLLLGNGFFVGAEFALIAARRTRIEPLAEHGSRLAAAALRAMGQLPLMVAGAQLGITVCSLGLGALAEPAIAHLLEGPLGAAGVDERALHPVAFVTALAIVVFLHTVIGEMVPKNIALAGPERAVLVLGLPMLVFARATRPLLVALKWMSQRLLRLARIEPTEAVKTVFTAEELASLVTESRTEGLLDEADHGRLHGALALTTRTAGEVMVAWSAVDAVPAEVTPEALEQLATATGHTRFPVVRPATAFAASAPGRPAASSSMPGLASAGRLVSSLAGPDGTARSSPRGRSALAGGTVLTRVVPIRAAGSRSPAGRAPVAVLGYVNVKDVLGAHGAARTAAIAPEAVRPLGVTGPGTTLAELLLVMRRDRSHLVLVADGDRPLGVATLDDVLAAVVGGQQSTPLDAPR